MSKKDCVISVDLGTSSVRACVVNSELNILFQAQKPLDLLTDLNGKAEQIPPQILEASIDTIRQASAHAKDLNLPILAISFSNAVSSLVQLNKRFDPIGNFLTYADLRSFNEVVLLRRQNRPEFFKNSAVPLHASYWMPKILWLKQNGYWDQATRYLCTIKDLLVQRFSNRFVTDYSNAVATGISDVILHSWHPAFLGLMGLDRNYLPEILPTTEKLEIANEMADHLGVSRDTILVLGATDGVLSSLGAGAVNPGQVTTMIGSSGACRIASDRPLLSEENLTWSYPLADDIWIRGGAMNSGGLVTKWMLSTLYSKINSDEAELFNQMLSDIQTVPHGTDGLLFLPYIFGERAPIWDEKARGVYYGIHANHNREHFARATIEGIIFALFSIFEIISSNVREKIEIRATGGYTRSVSMVQIQADIFGHPIKLPHSHEGSVIGAAALAFKSIGKFESISDVDGLIGINQVVEPNYENYDNYQKAYEQFKTLYMTLKPMFSNQQ